jgi:hypothetical protein
MLSGGGQFWLLDDSATGCSKKISVGHSASSRSLIVHFIERLQNACSIIVHVFAAMATEILCYSNL